MTTSRRTHTQHLKKNGDAATSHLWELYPRSCECLLYVPESGIWNRNPSALVSSVTVPGCMHPRVQWQCTTPRMRSDAHTRKLSPSTGTEHKHITRPCPPYMRAWTCSSARCISHAPRIRRVAVVWRGLTCTQRSAGPLRDLDPQEAVRREQALAWPWELREPAQRDEAHKRSYAPVSKSTPKLRLRSAENCRSCGPAFSNLPMKKLPPSALSALSRSF